MSYDYIPQIDYSGTRAERRRKEKEATRSERKLNPSQHLLNRKHRRHPTYEDKIVIWKEGEA